MQSTNTSHFTASENVDETASRQKSILIVMPETRLFAGEDFAGSTLMALATSLAKAQHKVVMLVLDHGSLTKAELSAFTKKCAEAPIALRYIIRDKYPHFAGQKCACDSYMVFQWLSENEKFDVVHFPELTGLGYYCQLAKRQGLAFRDTHFVVDILGPSLWRASLNQEFVTSPELLALDFLERGSVKIADSVFAPVPLYLDILKAEGWALPQSQYKLQLNILTNNGNGSQVKPITGSSAQGSQRNVVKELVYLGVMEERDGLSAFCDALDQLLEKLPRDFQITFLGSLPSTAGRNADAYISVRAQNWPWNWQFLRTDEQHKSIEYLKAAPRLAILGSSTTTSLLLGFQCAINSIPFLCNEDCRGKIITDYTAVQKSFFKGDADLARKLASEHTATQIGAAPHISGDHKRWWIDAHQNIFRATHQTSKTSTEDQTPLVSVCMAHYNRPNLLSMALDSLKAQDYANIEVIVADDGSKAEGAQQKLDVLEKEIADRNWKILRLPHRNVGATRSAAAAAAAGDFILFMDDDNVAYPHEISTMVKIANNTGADIVTCFFDAFEGETAPEPDEKPLYRKIFLGGAPDCGLTENVYGDANALIKRSLYFDLGGFEDAPGVAWHDWTFFARAVLKGANLQVCPVPLLWYRVAANSMNRTSSEWRSAQSIIKEYEDAMPGNFKHFPSLLYGLIKDPAVAEQMARGDAQRIESVAQNAASQLQSEVHTTPLTPSEPRAHSQTQLPIQSQSQTDAPITSQTLRQSQPQPERPPEPQTSLKKQLASNKFLLYCWWLVTWQLPLRLHERQAAIKLFEARVKKLGMTDLFDARWYRSKYGAGIEDPISHYLTTGAASGLEPGPNFNSRWYVERSSGAVSGDITLLEHYLEHGASAGIEPSPESHPDFAEFDPDYYIQNNPDLASIQISPFAHFVLYGKAEGRAPNAKMAPIANFDADWYLARYPEVAEEKIDPLEHFKTRGQFEGKVPRAEDDPEGIGFDEYWYCQRYPDLAEATVPPLMHYLIYGRQEGRLKRPLDGPNSIAKTLNERFPEQQALRVFAVPKLSKRITLILDSINAGLQERNGTAIIFAALWSEHCGTPLRIVTRNELSRAASVTELLAASGIKLSKAIEFTSYFDRENNSQLSTGSSESFITSSYRNTESVIKVIPPEQVVYLLQEDERVFYSSRDEYLRCSELLANSRIRYVVNTQLLLDNLAQEGFSNFEKNAVAFEPAFSSKIFHQKHMTETGSDEVAGRGTKKNFFFYARPESHAALYYRGLEVISQALEQQILRHTDWTFHFVGANLAQLKLPGNVTPQVSYDLNDHEYAELLRATDLGLALNLTPHPGYQCLELAASGAAVVTNTYQNKKSLANYSANILCSEPSVESLVRALRDGVKLARDKDLRSQNYLNSKLSRNWQKSFEDAFRRLPGT
jgi:glycosyltransferase involved in cell wall biosynthesis